MRVLVCGIASIALIVAGALTLDWYRLSFEPAAGGPLQIAIDLRSLHLCHVGQICVHAPLTPLPGMFPTLAALTMWSSLAVAAGVALQAGVRILTGNAYDALTKVGYMVSLMAISIAVATAYMFGPESEGSMIGAAAQAGVLLQRTWAPVTLIAGLVAGFATLYMTVAPESSDLAAAYKPVKLAPAPARPDARIRTPSVRIPFPEHTGTFLIPDPGASGAVASARPSTANRPTTDMRAPRTRTVAVIQPIRERTAIGSQPLGVEPATAERTATGTQPIGVPPARPPRLAPAAPPDAANPPPRGPAAEPPPRRERAATGVYAIPTIAMPDPVRERTPTHAPPLRERAATGVPAARERFATGGVREIMSARAVRARTGGVVREPTGRHAARERISTAGIREAAREPSGLDAPRERPATGPVPALRPAAPAVRPLQAQPAAPRPATGQTAPRPPTGPIGPIGAVRPPTGPIAALPAVSRTKTGPILAPQRQLRYRLSYVAITAELTGGGIDARRDDGLSRLVLWRDVVGVVARRMPAVYDGLVFIDVVSTAGSTLRIVPWTRLSGEPIAGEADARPRAIIEHVVARCPGAKLDPATRQFLEAGMAAQIPDLETLRAHDERLA
jgi:hypothetical protein